MPSTLGRSRGLAPLVGLLLVSLLPAACTRPAARVFSAARHIDASGTVATAAADWEGSGTTVIVDTPEGWTTRDPTVIFLPGGGIPARAYGCYANVWADLRIRTLILQLEEGGNRSSRRERWGKVRAVYAQVSRKQEPQEVVFAGHSAGAYFTLLAAGADSLPGLSNIDDCPNGGCTPLPAAGYVIISGQAAQSAEGHPPFWFARDAFRRLAPNRFVAYGTRDYMPTDPCANHPGKIPACRGDAFTVDADSAGAGQSVLRVIDGFTHHDFICSESQPDGRETAERRRELALEMGKWIRTVARH